jgi:hypothetical protein
VEGFKNCGIRVKSDPQFVDAAADRLTPYDAFNKLGNKIYNKTGHTVMDLFICIIPKVPTPT